MERRSPRSTAEESAEEEEDNDDDDDEGEEEEKEEEADVQRKKKNVLDEKRRGKRTEGEVDRTKGRRASISRSTVATPKVYHSGAQSVGCVRGTFGPLTQKADVDGRTAEEGERKRGETGRNGGTGNREGVGVPSYLVIYSPRAPGYPSRGITQGWAHRAPVVSLLRARRAATIAHGLRARFVRLIWFFFLTLSLHKILLEKSSRDDLRIVRQRNRWRFFSERDQCT